MPNRYHFCGTLLCLFSVGAMAADWNQWRGPNRDGIAPQSLPLIESLPAGGLAPVWMSAQPVAGRGWASPVVADGAVFIYSHKNDRIEGVELPPEKYPRLSDEVEAKLSKEQKEAYDTSRIAERSERRSKLYRWKDAVQSFDAQTGELRWEQTFASGQSRHSHSSTPAVVDARVYFLGADVVARCLSAEDGALLWETPLTTDAEREELKTENVPSSFVIADGIAAVLGHGLHALDARTGNVVWSAEETVPGSFSSPVVWQHGNQSSVIVHTAQSETVCVDLKTGDEMWREKTGVQRSSPVIAGDRLLALGGSRKTGLRCFGLSATGLDEQWSYQGVADPGAGPVVAGDKVFAQGDRRLVCIDLATGDPVWRTTLDVERPRYTSPVVADGKLFYTFGGVQCFDATSDHAQRLYNGAIRREDGLLAPENWFRSELNMSELERTNEGQLKAQQLWNKSIRSGAPLECSSPAIVDGRLYLRIKSGHVVCYDLRRDE